MNTKNELLADIAGPLLGIKTDEGMECNKEEYFVYRKCF